MEGMEEFDLSSFGLSKTDFDLQSLLQDKDLLRDLHSLGWTENVPAAPPAVPPTAPTSRPAAPPRPPRPAPATAAAAQPTVDVENITLLDISHLVPQGGGDDIEGVELSADDLQDEELLREYATLSGTSPPTQPTPSIIQTPTLPNTQTPTPTLTHTSSTTQPLPTPIHTISPPESQFDSVTTVEEAQRRAILAKRAGDTDLALRWFRVAKKLKQEIPALPQTTQIAAAQSKKSAPMVVPTQTKVLSTTATLPPAAPPVALSQETRLQQFRALEAALTESAQQSLSLAQQAKAAKNTALALQHMRTYKAYQQDLTVVQTRLSLPYAHPPLFHWESVSHSEEIRLEDLAENALRVTVKEITDMDNLISAHSSRSISLRITYNGSTSSAEEASNVTVTSQQKQYDMASHRAVFDFTAFLPVLNVKRGKLAATSLSRKRNALFVEVVLHRGFFRGDVVLARAFVSLSALTEQCESQERVALSSGDEKDAKRQTSSVGNVTLSLAVRTPLVRPHVRVWEDRKLVVGQWPTLDMSSQTVTAVSTSTSQAVTAVSPSASQASASPPPGFEDVPESALKDPESVSLLESNDVLSAEIARVEEALSQISNTTSDDDTDASLSQIALQSRLQLLRIKLQLLENKVMSEELSLAEYLDLVRECVKKDTRLALALRAQKTKESNALAVRVYGRVKIMQQEVATAESASEENESEEVMQA